MIHCWEYGYRWLTGITLLHTVFDSLTLLKAVAIFCISHLSNLHVVVYFMLLGLVISSFFSITICNFQDYMYFLLFIIGQVRGLKYNIHYLIMCNV